MGYTFANWQTKGVKIMVKKEKLNKIDLLYIKGLLHTEKKIKQSELEQLEKVKAKTPEYIYRTNILHLQSEIEKIEKIIDKLN